MSRGEDLQAFISAIDEWNSIPDCNLYFTSNHHTFNSANEYNWFSVNVEVSNDDNFFNSPEYHDYNSELGILVELPLTSFYPSYNILIDTSHDEYSGLDSVQKKYAFMHALGHMINLKDAEKRDDWIPGTYNNNNSIMTSYSYLKDWNDQWEGFTYEDIEDLSYVYPLTAVIVSDVSLDEVKDDLLPNEQLKLYKPYVFTTTASVIKKGNHQLSYDYSITGGAYEMEHLNDSTIRVVFTETGLYDISVTVNSDYLDMSFENYHSDSQRYTVVGDYVGYPNAVSRNVPFELYWRYTNQQYPEATIVFTGIEHLFDNDDSNISITNIHNGKAKVMLKDFGQFTITMKAIKPNGDVLEQHKLHVEKYYHPTMDVIDTCDYFKEVPFSCFEIEDICEENMRQATTDGQVDTQALAVRLDTRNSFRHRCYIQAYKKYHRKLYDFARRVDVRHVTDTSFFIPLLFNKDDIALYFVPSQKYHMSAGVGGLGGHESADYTSYMTFIVPDDKIRFE